MPHHRSADSAPSVPPALLPALARWQLVPDGEVLHTGGACLLPVRWQGQAAMLKVALTAEEERGYALLQWWQGEGAVRVLARAGAALLMERVAESAPSPSLAALSRSGQDAQASRILCQAVVALHQPRTVAAPAGLVPLSQWFQALLSCSGHAGWLAAAQATAQDLLAQPRDPLPLHGDIHHGNVLDGGARGWLAIDPKGLWGERGFDYANLFCNPDAALAADPQRFAARVEQVAQQAQIERQRLLQWVLAWAGLSTVWHLEDGTDAAAAQAAGQLAAAQLDGLAG